MSRGTRYRLPRKFKKAWTAALHNNATPKQMNLICRAVVIVGMGGWNRIRHGNAHVAMGDTSTMRRRIRLERRLNVR